MNTIPNGVPRFIHEEEVSRLKDENQILRDQLTVVLPCVNKVASLTAELYELGKRMDDATRTLGRHQPELCDEMRSQLSLLRKDLSFIRDNGGKSIDTEYGRICCDGTWCADQARWSLINAGCDKEAEKKEGET